MLTSEKVGYLRAMEIFRDLTSEDLDWLERVTTMVTCEKGRLIYAPEQTGEILFLLKKGAVQLYRLSREGKKLVVASLGAGTFFGEMSLVGQGMYDAFAEALEDCTLCAMSRADVERLLLDKPVVCLRILDVLGKRMLEMERALEQMAFKSVPARLATLLVRVAEQRQTSEVLGITHQDMAEMAGTLRETVTQSLNEFKAHGIIEIRRKRVTILDMEALREVAQC